MSLILQNVIAFYRTRTVSLFRKGTYGCTLVQTDKKTKRFCVQKSKSYFTCNCAAVALGCGYAYTA